LGLRGLLNARKEGLSSGTLGPLILFKLGPWVACWLRTAFLEKDGGGNKAQSFSKQNFVPSTRPERLSRILL
jgi:hypothetical protein